MMNLKEKRRRKAYNSSEISQLLYKQLYNNCSYNIKRKISFKFSEKVKDCFSSRILNRCLITDRSRGIVSREYKVARYPFRLLALNGLIPGIHKFRK